ncbi:hypothetical protein MK079_04265 [Candidatus Gracilibacteria bacterium]|nr:hypothetical protein [Candidatus Gracilibacteria bacterium]
MNFGALKSMIESMIQQNKCSDCGASFSDENVDIVGAAGSNMNLEFHCHECGNTTMVKSQLMSFKINNDILQSMDTGHKNNSLDKKKIVDLDEKLKENSSIEDLFGDN